MPETEKHANLLRKSVCRLKGVKRQSTRERHFFAETASITKN